MSESLQVRSAYSSVALRRCVKASDSRDFDLDLKADRFALVETAVQAAALDPSPVGNSSTLRVRGKVCHYYPEYSTNLILRSTARYISQRYRISAPNRDRVVRSVIETVCEGTPFHVIRRDIESFYENIPTEQLRERLLFDTSISKQVRRHLKAYFSLSVDNERGLPRGIGLTTILAELAMHGFDNTIRSIPGVYKYFRYSDDILVFAVGDLTTVEKMIEGALPSTMKFNKTKCDAISFFPSNDADERKDFDYLGYNFSALTAIPKRGKPRDCDVSIAEVKIKKLKTRIVLALKKFKANESSLLLYRMRYLSGNYKLTRLAGHHELLGNFTRSGIYYNYRRCGRHSGAKHTETARPELTSVDWFYHNLLTSNRSRFSGIAPSLPTALAARLADISFERGHTMKLHARVPSRMSSRVKSAWRDH